MKTIYSNFTEKKFKVVAITCALFSDLVIAKYIWFIFADKTVFEKYFVQAIDQMKHSPNFDEQLIPKDFFNEFFQIWTSSLVLMLIAVILVHLLNYLFYYQNRLFAFKYLRIQAWIGGVGLLLAGIPNILNDTIYLALAAAGVALLFVANGLKIFKVKSPALKS